MESTAKMYDVKTCVENKYYSDLEELFKKTYWTTERNFGDFKKMIDNTDFIVAVMDKKQDKLVGITRVLTDFTYIALICDVMVLPEYQKKGLGKYLIDSVMDSEEMKKIEQIELYCKEDMIQFYEKWDFKNRDGDLFFMRKKK